MKITRFEDLECWQSARDLVNRVYRVCSVNELKKNFSLSDQIKRAGISIMANIAEGFSRKSNKEFIQFLFISKASAAELQSHLYIALDQQYIDRSSFDDLYSDADKVQRQISNLIKYLNSTIQTRKPDKLNKPE
jgi:four helix bundle protein